MLAQNVSNATNAKRRAFKTSKSKTVVGSDAFTNLKTCNDYSKTYLTEARKPAVDKNNKNDGNTKHKILARTKSEYLDNEKSLRRSLLITRMGTSFDASRTSLPLTNQRAVSSDLSNLRPESSKLTNQMRIY